VTARVPARESITGVVLAGGRGARMGGADKGLAIFQGRALVVHVLERLQPQVADILICANRNQDRYRALGHRVVEDDRERFGLYAGPLVGMLAGLRHSRLPWVAFVPCDAPALPEGLVAALARASQGARPALASCDGQPQPVFCLLPTTLEEQLAATLARGERRPREFLRAVDAVEVAFEEPRAFANINAAQAGLRVTDE